MPRPFPRTRARTRSNAQGEPAVSPSTISRDSMLQLHPVRGDAQEAECIITLSSDEDEARDDNNQDLQIIETTDDTTVEAEPVLDVPTKAQTPLNFKNLFPRSSSSKEPASSAAAAAEVITLSDEEVELSDNDDIIFVEDTRSQGSALSCLKPAINIDHSSTEQSASGKPEQEQAGEGRGTNSRSSPSSAQENEKDPSVDFDLPLTGNVNNGQCEEISKQREEDEMNIQRGDSENVVLNMDEPESELPVAGTSDLDLEKEGGSIVMKDAHSCSKEKECESQSSNEAQRNQNVEIPQIEAPINAANDIMESDDIITPSDDSKNDENMQGPEPNEHPTISNELPGNKEIHEAHSPVGQDDLQKHSEVDSFAMENESDPSTSSKVPEEPEINTSDDVEQNSGVSENESCGTNADKNSSVPASTILKPKPTQEKLQELIRNIGACDQSTDVNTRVANSKVSRTDNVQQEESADANKQIFSTVAMAKSPEPETDMSLSSVISPRTQAPSPLTNVTSESNSAAENQEESPSEAETESTDTEVMDRTATTVTAAPDSAKNSMKTVITVVEYPQDIEMNQDDEPVEAETGIVEEVSLEGNDTVVKSGRSTKAVPAEAEKETDVGSNNTVSMKHVARRYRACAAQKSVSLIEKELKKLKGRIVEMEMADYDLDDEDSFVKLEKMQFKYNKFRQMLDSLTHNKNVKRSLDSDEEEYCVRLAIRSENSSWQEERKIVIPYINKYLNSKNHPFVPPVEEMEKLIKFKLGVEYKKNPKREQPIPKDLKHLCENLAWEITQDLVKLLKRDSIEIAEKKYANIAKNFPDPTPAPLEQDPALLAALAQSDELKKESSKSAVFRVLNEKIESVAKRSSTLKAEDMFNEDESNSSSSVDTDDGAVPSSDSADDEDEFDDVEDEFDDEDEFDGDVDEVDEEPDAETNDGTEDETVGLDLDDEGERTFADRNDEDENEYNEQRRRNYGSSSSDETDEEQVRVNGGLKIMSLLGDVVTLAFAKGPPVFKDIPITTYGPPIPKLPEVVDNENDGEGGGKSAIGSIDTGEEEPPAKLPRLDDDPKNP